MIEGFVVVVVVVAVTEHPVMVDVLVSQDSDDIEPMMVGVQVTRYCSVTDVPDVHVDVDVELVAADDCVDDAVAD